MKALTEAEILERLKLLGDMRGRQLNEDEKKTIAEFINGCKCNKALRKVIYDKEEDFLAQNIHPQAIFTVILLTFFTRTIEEEVPVPRQLSKEEAEIHKKVLAYAISSYNLDRLYGTFKQLKEITPLLPDLQILHEQIRKAYQKEIELENSPAKKETVDQLRDKKESRLFLPSIDKYAQYWANFIKDVLEEGEAPNPRPK